MNNKLRRVLMMCSIVLPNSLPAQNLHFTYDNAGNRLEKSLVSFMSRASSSKSITTQEQETFAASNVSLSLNDNIITIFFSNYHDIDGDVTISTMDGKVLANFQVNSPIVSFNMKQYQNGVYVICARLNDKKQSWKIQKV